MKQRRLALTLLMTLPLSAACGDDGGDNGTTDSDGKATTSGSTDSGASDGSQGTSDGSQGTSDGGTDGHGTDGHGTDGHGTDGTDTDGGMAAFELNFAVKVGDEVANCSDSFADVGDPASSIGIRDLRFYVSNLRLVSDDDKEVALELDQDGTWQHKGLALLDFEDASGTCTGSGNTADTNTSVKGMAPEGTYKGVKFDLGVPFELNHLDTATAPPPLNVTSMFWNWQGGYKFVRFDFTNENMAPDNAWNLHLGSTGCASGGPTDPPEKACAKPNRPEITLTDFDPASDTIVVDIAGILTGVDVTSDTTGTPKGCMSFPPDVNECTDLFPNLGLSWDTGACDNDCVDQKMFIVE